MVGYEGNRTYASLPQVFVGHKQKFGAQNTLQIGADGQNSGLDIFSCMCGFISP